MSSVYLRWLIFLPAILIPAYASSSPAFLMMYSACKLNEYGDNMQPWRTLFPIWNQSAVPCPVLTVASWPAQRFLRRQVRWSYITICLRILHSLLWSTQSKSAQHTRHFSLLLIIKEFCISSDLTNQSQTLVRGVFWLNGLGWLYVAAHPWASQDGKRSIMLICLPQR